MIVEHPVDIAFWPHADAIRWWTVRNHRGSTEVLRVDTELQIPAAVPEGSAVDAEMVAPFLGSTVRMVVYMSFSVGQFTHPPLAACLLRGGQFDTVIETTGGKLLFCLDPEGNWTPAGLKREKLFMGVTRPLYPPMPLDAPNQPPEEAAPQEGT